MAALLVANLWPEIPSQSHLQGFDNQILNIHSKEDDKGVILARRDLFGPLPGSLIGFLVMGSRVDITEVDMIEQPSSSSSPSSSSLSLPPRPEAEVSIMVL